MLYEIFRHYMKNNTRLTTKRPKPQTEVDQYVLNFLGDSAINVPEDLVVLKDKILDSLEARPYNTETKEHADSIQWARTASEILQDKYIYQGKACSDIAIVFLALCRALGIDGRLVKLKSVEDNNTHSIVEVNLNNIWYRIDPSSKNSIPFEGELTDKSIWNKKFKVWKKGKDVWDLGLNNIESEAKIC